MVSNTIEQQATVPTDLAGRLMRVTREIGVVLLRLRQENELLEFVITRITQAFRIDYGAILLHDGKMLTLTAYSGSEDESSSPLLHVFNLVERLMNEGATDVQVLSDIDASERGEERNGSRMGALRTLILTPLAAHATPMGVIVLANTDTRSLLPTELDALRLIGQLLAGRLREMRLQAKLDATARRLASQSERFDPNSTLDPQMGMANKQRFLEGIQQGVSDAIQTGGHLSLLIIVTDHLQAISQKCGNAFVEEVLSRMAKDIQGSIRARDMTARYNGEEFWVLLPSTPGIGAVVVAERLRERISEMTFQSQEGPWHLTASIGVACLSAHATSSEQIIVKAEQCLSQSQRLGGNQIIFDWDEALEMMSDE